MLENPQRYPRAGSQGYPSPAAVANLVPGKGLNVILRVYSPLEPFLTKTWRSSEIQLVP